MDCNHIRIYTDGACSGNPGKGGYGIIMEWVGRQYYREFSQGYALTTNNRMELLAVIEALRKLKRSPMMVEVYTDSKYVADAVIKKWVFSWEKKAFHNRKNADLWRVFLSLFRKHYVTFHWIKGHNQHPQNERCDALAVEAIKHSRLLIDEGFEKGL